MCHLQLHIKKTGTYCNIIDLVSEQHNLPVCNTSEQYVEVMKCIFNKLLSDTPWLFLGVFFSRLSLPVKLLLLQRFTWC